MAKLQSYAVSIALTKLKHSIITAKSGQKCLVLPIDDNYLNLKDDAVYMQTDVVVMEVDDKENHGFQVQKIPSEIYKNLGTEKEKKIVLPYLGSLKIFARKNSDAVEQSDIEMDDDLDMPF